MMRDDLPDTAPPFQRVKTVGRILWLVMIAAGLVVAWRERAALDPIAIRNAIAAYPAAPLVFLVAQVVASLLFIPRTLLAVAAGLLFGAWWGVFWAAVGGTLGAVGGFLVARYVNSGWLDLESLPRLGPVLRKAERGGWRAVTALRLIPVIPHSLSNYALGLTRIGLGSYTVGSFLGQLPMTVAYVDLAAAGGRLAGGRADWLLPILIGAAALLVSVALPRLWRR
ncbi:MAG: TVP38/TMEM64 family protein [Alphaproteobacteria bacterium]|nr:TVP38/TMEM64 family protein [Alphaproteobacteria bacterium]